MEKLGFFDDNLVFYLGKGGHQKVFTYFKNFYIHRVQFIGLHKKFSKGFVDTEARDSHKPVVSEKNCKLAENRRKKLTGGRDNVTFVEILL